MQRKSGVSSTTEIRSEGGIEMPSSSATAALGSSQSARRNSGSFVARSTSLRSISARPVGIGWYATSQLPADVGAGDVGVLPPPPLSDVGEVATGDVGEPTTSEVGEVGPVEVGEVGVLGVAAVDGVDGVPGAVDGVDGVDGDSGVVPVPTGDTPPTGATAVDGEPGVEVDPGVAGVLPVGDGIAEPGTLVAGVAGVDGVLDVDAVDGVEAAAGVAGVEGVEAAAGVPDEGAVAGEAPEAGSTMCLRRRDAGEKGVAGVAGVAPAGDPAPVGVDGVVGVDVMADSSSLGGLAAGSSVDRRRPRLATP